MGRRKNKSNEKQDAFNPDDIRSFSLYAIKMSNDKYYVGYTERKDVTRRIRQHGGRMGAFVNFGFKVVEVVEVRRLGKIKRSKASMLENEMTIEYMDKYGKQNVKGGLMVRPGWIFLRTYCPGSDEWITQTFWLMLAIFFIIVVCFVVIMEV